MFDPAARRDGRGDASIGARATPATRDHRRLSPRRGAHDSGDLAQAVLEAVEAVEIKLCAAPPEDFDGLEIVVLEPVHQALVEGLTSAVTPKVPSLRWRRARPATGASSVASITVRAAIEPAGAGERDVIHIEIEAHTDRVGGNEEIDLARLIERDLGVARRGLRALRTTATCDDRRCLRISSAIV